MSAKICRLYVFPNGKIRYHHRGQLYADHNAVVAVDIYSDKVVVVKDVSGANGRGAVRSLPSLTTKFLEEFYTNIEHEQIDDFDD